MTEIEKFYVRQFALYATPTTAYKAGVEKLGEKAATPAQVRRMREKFRGQIISQRKELMASIPILDPFERWAYLQAIIDGALDGEIVYDKNGMPVEAKVDRTSALTALKLAHEMTQTKGTLNTEDEDMVRVIVQDAYNALREDNPTKPDKEILDEILDTLGERVKPYLHVVQVSSV